MANTRSICTLARYIYSIQSFCIYCFCSSYFPLYCVCVCSLVTPFFVNPIKCQFNSIDSIVLTHFVYRPPPHTSRGGGGQLNCQYRVQPYTTTSTTVCYSNAPEEILLLLSLSYSTTPFFCRLK